MSTEKISVGQMIRTTAENQGIFLTQIAEHIEKLENALVELQNRVTEMETANGNNNAAQ
jgi:hypothetical protein